MTETLVTYGNGKRVAEDGHMTPPESDSRLTSPTCRAPYRVLYAM